MQNLIFPLSVIGLFFYAFQADAFDAKSIPKLGYVNFEVAFSQEHEAQKYTAELEKAEQSILEAEQKARTDIESKMAKFQASMAKLSDKARQEQQTALGEEINALQQQFGQRRLELNQKKQNILADLENKNRLLLESVSRKEAYAMVFNSAALVYVNDDIKKNDLTAKLIAEYNKAYPVKPEAQKKTTPLKKAPEVKPPMKNAPPAPEKAVPKLKEIEKPKAAPAA